MIYFRENSINADLSLIGSKQIIWKTSFSGIYDCFQKMYEVDPL